mgnify:CR=1 FL=1|jgi:hypothetical protein
MKGHNLWKPKLFIAKDKSFVSKIINYLIIMKRVKRFKYKIFKNANIITFLLRL